ncbi:MAG: YjgN family protein [Rhizobacter sp.]
MSQPASSHAAVEPYLGDDVAPAGEPQTHRLDIRFTGSGSEYFRIWIVNLLLTIVTLSLYHPWAKVRRLRYFYGNTLVGGQPLDFHGNPLAMLRGYLLVGALVVLYSVAGHFSPTAGLFAFVVIAALWPALLKSSMQFRLANTSWRGLRFAFRGSLGGAYAALLPMFVPGVIIVAAVAAMPDVQQPPAWFGIVYGVVFLLTMALLPWAWWRLKKYQHDHYAFGAWQTGLSAGCASVYGVFFKTIAVTMLAVVLLVVAIGIAAAVAWASSRLGGLGGAGGAIVGLGVGLLTLLTLQLVPRPFFVSRMQNLLWSRTGNREMRFASTLRFWPLFGLTLKNWLLVAVTLGFYWPFAAVATRRLQIEAVSIVTRDEPDSLVDRYGAAGGDAAGDAAGDLLGIDIGL